MLDGGVNELLTNVVSQLQCAQDNLANDNSLTLDSGFEPSDLHVESDLDLLIRDIKMLHDSVAVEALDYHTDDNATSLIDSISTALSQLEINRGHMSADIKVTPDVGFLEDSEEDNLERMVDVLFRNVRSLKSLLVPALHTDDISESTPAGTSDEKDETSELTKLIEIMTSSHRLTATNHSLLEETVSSESMRELEDYINHKFGHDNKIYETNGDPGRYNGNKYNYHENSNKPYGGNKWGNGGETNDFHQNKDTIQDNDSDPGNTVSSEYTDQDDQYRAELTGTDGTTTTEESTGSIMLEYGYIPNNDVMLYDRFSQCGSSLDMVTSPSRSMELRPFYSPSDDDSLIVSQVSLGMPQDELSPAFTHSKGSKPSSSIKGPLRKDVLDMYNKLLNDMSSLSNMIHQESKTDSTKGPSLPTDSTLNNSHHTQHLITGDTMSSLLSTNHDLSNVTNQVNKTTEPMKEAARIIDLLAKQRSPQYNFDSDPTTSKSSAAVLLNPRKHHLTSDSGVVSPFSKDSKENYLSDIIQEVDAVTDKLGKDDDAPLVTPTVIKQTYRKVNNKPPPSTVFTPSSEEPMKELSPGQIAGEWDDYTPQIHTPQSTPTSSQPSFILCDDELFLEETSLSDLYVPHLECTVETISSEHFSQLMVVMGSKEKLYEDSQPPFKYKSSSSPAELSSSYSDTESLSEDYYSDLDYWEFTRTRKKIVSSDSEAVVKPQRRISKGRKKESSDDTTLPSVESLLENARQSSSGTSRVISIETHSLNKDPSIEVIEVFTKHPEKEAPAQDEKKEELPAYLKLFLRPDEVPAYVPNTVLLNALLAPSGLTITPIISKNDQSIQCIDTCDDQTSHISVVSDKSLSFSDRSSLSYRPPKLKTLSADLTKEVSTNTCPANTEDTSDDDRMPGPLKIVEHISPALGTTPSPPPRQPITQPITPESMYNIPPPMEKNPSLLIDTWTCTNPLPEHADVSTETSFYMTEDRAASPIKTVTSDSQPTRSSTITKSIRSQQADMEPRDDVPIRIRSISESSISSVSSVSLEDMKVDDPIPSEPKLESFSPVNRSPAFDNTDKQIKTPTKDPPQVRVKSPKDPAQDDLHKALLAALIRRPDSKTLNIDTLKGIRSQLERQSSELLSARSRLANAGDRMRSKLDMFNMDRLDESVLEENI